MISRRGFLTGIIAACAAPAIIRVASIMPVKVMPATVEKMAAVILNDHSMDAFRYRYIYDRTSRSIIRQYACAIEFDDDFNDTYSDA